MLRYLDLWNIVLITTKVMVEMDVVTRQFTLTFMSFMTIIQKAFHTSGGLSLLGAYDMRGSFWV